MNNLFALAVFFSRLNTKLNVCALLLVVKRLAYIVQKTRALCKGNVRPQLRCQKPRKVANLKRMVKYILPVACAVFQLTEQPYKFGVQIMDARVYHGALALLLYGRLNLGGRLGYCVLNSAGMNTSVKN